MSIVLGITYTRSLQGVIKRAYTMVQGLWSHRVKGRQDKMYHTMYTRVKGQDIY